MKKNKNISWVVSALTFTFLMACADESPVSSLEEEYHYSSSSSKKYSSSSYYYGNSYSSSSVSESEETEEEKEMVLTLTYYKQNKTSGEDRDPEISFKIYTLNDDGDTLQSLKTEQLTDWDNVTEWDVRIEAPPLTIAAGVATIYVCPIIIDDDGILGNQNLSSKYCYGSGNIGTLKDQDVVEQSDYENTKSILEWEWYLY